jgi:hypothetical protein
MDILFSYIQTHNTKTITIYTQKATDFDVMYLELTQHLASNTVLASKKQEQKEQYPFVINLRLHIIEILLLY